MANILDELRNLLRVPGGPVPPSEFERSDAAMGLRNLARVPGAPPPIDPRLIAMQQMTQNRPDPAMVKPGMKGEADEQAFQERMRSEAGPEPMPTVPSTEEELETVRNAMGKRVPTPGEVQRLIQNPGDGMLNAFADAFGPEHIPDELANHPEHKGLVDFLKGGQYESDEDMAGLESDWEGTDKPTANDIKALRDMPTDGMLESFVKRFGEDQLPSLQPDENDDFRDTR